MQPRPGGSITAQAQNLLKTQGAGSRFLTRHPPERLEPQGQGLMRILKDRTRRDGRLVTAGVTNNQSSTGGPSFSISATWANEPFWPPHLEKICQTVILGGEPGIEFRLGLRVIVHALTYYMS